MLPFLLVLGCGGEPAAAAVDQTCDGLVDWDSWGQGFFTTWCRSCHSATAGDRRGAPPGMDFDTWEEVWALREAIGRVVLEDQTMPVGGGLSEEQLTNLHTLLACDGGGDSSAGVPNEDPVAPTLTAADVEARADRAVAGGLPLASVFFSAYVDILLAHGNDGCPSGWNEPPYATRADIDGCTTADGWVFAGLVDRGTEVEGAEIRETCAGDAWGMDPEGRSLVLGGSLAWTVDAEAGTWSEQLDGSWGYEGAEGWQAELPSTAITVSGEGENAVVVGGISFDDVVVFYDGLRLDAAACPRSIAGGEVRVRDEAGGWSVVSFGEDCSACGDAVYEPDGSVLGEVCLDVGPLWDSLGERG